MTFLRSIFILSLAHIGKCWNGSSAAIVILLWPWKKNSFKVLKLLLLVLLSHHYENHYENFSLCNDLEISVFNYCHIYKKGQINHTVFFFCSVICLPLNSIDCTVSKYLFDLHFFSVTVPIYCTTEV